MSDLHLLKRVHVCLARSGRYVVFRYVAEKKEATAALLFGGPQPNGLPPDDVILIAEKVSIYSDREEALKRRASPSRAPKMRPCPGPAGSPSPGETAAGWESPSPATPTPSASPASSRGPWRPTPSRPGRRLRLG